MDGKDCLHRFIQPTFLFSQGATRTFWRCIECEVELAPDFLIPPVERIIEIDARAVSSLHPARFRETKQTP